MRQKIQVLVQQWWQAIGIATELRNIESAVFFGGDPASPDTLGKFYADTAMFANGPDSPDPQNYLVVWTCEVDGESNIASAQNEWLRPEHRTLVQPRNMTPFLPSLPPPSSPGRRARLAIALNDLIVQGYVNLPVIFHATVSAHVNSLQGVGAEWVGEYVVEYTGVATRGVR